MLIRTLYAMKNGFSDWVEILVIFFPGKCFCFCCLIKENIGNELLCFFFRLKVFDDYWDNLLWFYCSGDDLKVLTEIYVFVWNSGSVFLVISLLFFAAR